MLQSRQGMRVGRAKFRAGDVDLAIHIWTKALESAYTAQDYAVMYVLSKNLGDAFARLTAEQQQQKNHSTAAIESLQKSIDYYEYALNVVDECALREVLSDASHHVLNRSARHVHAAHQRLQAKMNRLRKLPPAIEEQPCTTCEELFESLVLDESDGCLYCQACYDAFYASVENVEQESSITSQVSSVSAEAEAETTATVHETEIAGFSIADSADTCGECDDAIEDSSEELAEVSISVFSEEPVEDVEATAREPTLPHHEAVVFSTANDTDMDIEAVEKPALKVTEKSSSFEAADQDPAQAKQVYTISELLTLRTQTPVGLCPEAILSSLVAVGGDSTSSKTNSAKSWDRKSSSKQSKSSSIKTKNPQTTSPRNTTSNPRHLSALPSMELCNTLRDAAAAPAARKSQDSGSISLLDIQQMATALFDSGREHANGDDGDEAPSAGSCTSFASDLAHFASIVKA